MMTVGLAASGPSSSAVHGRARSRVMIAESAAFDYLDAPIVRLGGAEAPIPYNPELEKAVVPQVPDIVAAARDLVQARI